MRDVDNTSTIIIFVDFNKMKSTTYLLYNYSEHLEKIMSENIILTKLLMKIPRIAVEIWTCVPQIWHWNNLKCGTIDQITGHCL